MLAMAALCALAAAAPAGAADLADATLAIAGAKLTVSPESQTVPFDTPTEVLTQLQGFDTAHGAIPANLLVLGDLTGPQISGVLTLSTVPGQPFQIPRLQTQGIYQLDNIRLMQGGNLLGYAQPRSAALTVTQVLVTSVTSRALTTDEIRSYGIALDSSSMQAYVFTFAFAVAPGQTVNYDLPVVFNQGSVSSAPLPLYQVVGQGGAVHGGPRFTPPRMAPFQLNLAPTNTGSGGVLGGCLDLEDDCSSNPPLPIPGVILFPTDISLLHQFFSVILMVQNGAPAGDPLVLRDLSARVTLPPGLRQASTLPPTPLGVPIPIRVPGPDGILGTADDITFLVAQASGEAQVLAEGLEQGTQIVQFDITGVVDGLPGGQRQVVTGQARGAVVVRDPTLNVTVTHPEVVRADEQYQLLLTVTNTGNSPANQLTLRLPPDKLAGVRVVGDSSHTIDLLPGDSQLVEFTLVSLLTGRVVADAVRSSAEITPTFDLSVGVGENNIPLSPNAIILPDAANSLPPDLLRAELNLIGLGYSLATAPPSLLTQSSLPEVSLGAIDSRVYELAQAGVEVSMGEAVFDSAAILAVLGTGGQDQDAAWDQLRRITQKGGSAGARLAAIFAAEAAATSPAAAFQRFAATTAFVRLGAGATGGGGSGSAGVAGIEGALAVGAGATLQVSSRASGARLAGDGEDPARLRELPFADLYLLDAQGASQMALLAVPEATGYQAQLRIAGGGSADLELLVPAADGSLRTVSWTAVALGAGGSATVTWAPGDTSFTLAVDPQGTGASTQQLAGSVASLAARAFGVVAAMQNSAVDPTGHIVDVLFTGDVDRSSLLPVDSSHFQIPGKLSNGGLTQIDADIVAQAAPGSQGAQTLHNSRLLRVVFNNPLSPYATPVNLTVARIKSAAGETLASAQLAVQITVTTPGEQVSGVVIGPDGQPVPFAQVTLHESDFCVVCDNQCNSHQTAIVKADSQGHYLFDYVRARPECGDSFGLSAADPASDEVGVATGRVRFIAQTARLDVLMLGRGTIRGHVAYDDGTLPANPQVVAYSPVFREWGNPTIDAYGNYSVSNVPVGTITLSASDGQGKFVITTLAVPTSGSVVDYDLIILRVPPNPVQTGQVRGQVVRPDGTTPVVLAWVSLYVDGNLIGVQRSDAAGNFDFGTVPAGQAEIDTFENETGQSGVQVFFQVNPDQVNQVKLTMNPNRGAVEGHVYRQTGSTITPLTGAVVWVEGQPFKTFTDSQGFYHLDGVFTGTWQVFAADLVNQVSVSQAATIEAEGATATRDLYFHTQLPSGFSGQVLGFDGSPVAGAVVHIAAGSLNWWAETSTDATGTFSFPGLVPGSYGVHAYLGQAGGTAVAVIRFPGDTPFVTIRFKAGTIKGLVQAKDANGQVTGLVATVTYRTTVVREGLLGLALDPTTIQTAPDGTFEIDNVLAGPYQISAYNSFYGSQTVSGQIVNQGEVQNQTLTFQLNGPGTIKGIVLDQDGVTPAAGASVHLAHPAFSAYDLTTGADGSFEFDLVPPTPWGFPVQVTFQSGVIFRQAQVWVSFTQPGQTLTLQIVLPKQGSVAGLVQDADGHPVPASVVTLAEGHYPYRQLTVNADANAAFQFSNVFAGPASLSARAPTLGGLGGKTSISIDQEGQALTGVLIKLQPTGSITGRVLSPVDGSAVPNAEVKLFSGAGNLVDTINADANGQFEFDLLPLGGYYVNAFDPTTGRQGQTSGLVVASNDQVVPGDVTLEARGGVLGHLYDPDSTPPLGVPVATVALTSEGITSFITYSSTDLAGAFQFQGIPQGDFTLAAREPQGRRNASGQGTIVHEGDQVTVDLTLQQEGTVTGSVFNPAGVTSGKFPNVNVTVTQDGQIIGGVLASDYRFGGIVAGRPFEIDAQEVGGHHAGSARATLVDATPLALDVQMVPLGSVRVVVQDSFGTPVPGANVTLYTNGFYGFHVLTASSSDTADAIFQDIGAGDLGVEVYDPVSTLYGSAQGTLTTDGQIVQLTAKLESTGTIRGTVLLADGVTPAVGATAGLQVGTRFFLVQTDGAGAFAFRAVPLGAFDLNFQQSFGPGTLEVLGAVTANGQVIDLGTLVLDATDLQVLSITPVDGSTNVSLTQAVAVTFNKPLDRNRTLANGAVSVTRSDGQAWPMNASLSADGATITLTPGRSFDNATTYLVRVNPPVFAASGKVLQQPAQASFTTVDHLLPVVIHIDPAPGAVQVPLGVQLHLIFNRPVDPNSLSGSHLQLLDLTDNLQVATTFTPLVGGRELLVTPQVALLQEKQYQLTVQGMVDLVGNVQAQPFVSTFFSLDTTPPRFGAVLPAAGAVYTAGDPVAIAVAASDPSGVHDVSVQLGPRGADLTAPAAGGSFQVTLAAPRVAAASDVPITIAATDVYGNVATMTRTIHVNPNPNQAGPAIATCLVEGDAVAPGVPLSVPLTASDDQAVESYDLAVDGQVVTTVVSAGVPAVTDAIAWTPPAGSAPGTSFAMRLDAYDFAGNVASVSFNLVVPAGTVLVGDQAIPPSAIVAGQPLSLAHGKFTAAAPLAVGSLTLMQGATLAPAAPGQPLTIAAAAAAGAGGAPGPVRIQCGASIDLGGLGYPGGVPGHATGYAPPWVAGAPQDAGGSHGGPGISSGGAAGGPVFDSVYQPQLGGGGGSQEGSFPGFAGAGAVTIDAGTLTLNGQIEARGIDGCLSAGSAGGAVTAHVVALTGAGTIDVGGGNAALDGCGPDFGYGAGGGGRVALYAGSVSGFSAAQVLAQGGALRNDGGFAPPGTLLWNVGGETFGDLVLDAGTRPDGSVRPVMPTPLPALGAGALAHLVAGGTGGADAWASASAAFTPEWVGATMDLLDAAGDLLGSFQVTRLDAGGRALLAGAGAVAGATGAGAATSYRGAYHFDNVRLLHGAGLAGADPVVAQNVTLSGNTEVAAVVQAVNLTVASGAVVKPAAGGSIHFVVSGTMTVAAGAVIDVSGLGYPGGVPGQSTGYAPPWVTGAPQDAGGSHGGAGIGAHRPGPGGPTFDSVYLPQLGGGGGSQENWFPGYAGGGTVTVDAGTLSLAGEIKARGIDGCLSAGSAGGSVLVRAGELDGAGTIDVSGGNAAANGCATSLYFYGGGGGGRAAIYATTLNGFAPASQVVTGGGALPDDSAYAAPGTLLVRLAGQTYGDLYVDGGAKPDGTPLPATPTALPRLGSGALTALAPAAVGGTPAVDAWVSAAAAFTPEWLGAWMDLLDASGNLLGAFQATQLDAGGRLLLAGAGGVPGPGSGAGGAAVSYRGEFRFDHVQLLHAAGLTAQDPVVAGTLVVTGANVLGPLLRPVDVDVRPGAAPLPPSGGSELDIIASGTITVEAGAKLDMSAKGYAGAFGGSPVGGPPGVAPAHGGGGGSHGGTGSGAGAGEIYDSVSQPALPGGGGGGSWSPPGGGVVHLEAANLVLAGQILADGGAVCNNGAAAGGTVFVGLSGTLSGAGTISAAGAAGCGYAYGGNGGGGGRVALLAQGFSGFDPAAQVHAAGGLVDSNPRQLAAAGTLFTKVAGQTYGSLRVDAGSPPAGTAPILATVLPTIGRGAIGSVAPAAGDPASVWITAQAGTPLFSLGAIGMWVRIGGADYAVTGQSADRTQLLLAGAAAAATVGTPFVGVYKYDQVTVTGDAVVQVEDAVAFGSTQVDPGAKLTELDLVAPVISAIQPAAGTVFTAGQPVAISFSVADDDLATVTVTFGEQSVTLTTPPFAWTVPAPAVAAASDVPIQIVATDRSANTASATQLVHVLPATAAGPPAVALTCPTTGAMLAPGTSLQLAATASEASGIEKVELYLGAGGSGTPPLAKLFSPPYTFTFTPPAGATDGQVLHVRVRATSFGDTTAEAAADFTVVTGNVLTATTEIAAGSTQYDGASLIVAGGTTTIDGPHTFRDLVVLDGATVNHSPTTAAQENHLAVTLTRNLYVACGGAVDVTGLGYLGGASGSTHAYGYGNTTAEGAAPAGAGGSHGGRGGRYDGSSPVYGSFWNPQDPGAGGGYRDGSPSGASGGGVVTIAAGGAGLIDGAVRASGGQHPEGGSGGGAGGSIRITAATLAGAGSIQALGGAPTAWPDPHLTGGGSGGRIALFGASIDAGLLSRTSAAGAAGTSTDPSTWGAAGTVFTKLDANPYGDLVIDNAGIASSQYTELLSVGAGTVTAVAATSFTDSQADFHHDLSGIDVVFNGNLGAIYPIVSHVHHGQTLNLQVATPPLSAAIQPGATYSGVYSLGNLAVRGGAQAIAVDAVTTVNPPQVASGASWTPGYAGTVAITSPAAGATLTAGAPLTVSASVADILGVSRVVLAVAGGGSVTLTSPPYTWSTNAPAVSSATDEAVTATVYAAGGNYLTASVTVHVNPAVDPLAPVVALTCWHDQDLVTPGTAIPISFTISDAVLVSSYSLVVNGATVQTVNANQASVAASLSWTPPAGTAPGTSFTVTVTATNPAGHVGSATIHLVTAAASALGGNLTLGSSYAGQSLVLGAGTYTVPAALSLNALTLMNGARVVGVAGSPLNLTVAGTLTVECGGVIDVTALGYLGATAYDTPGTAPPGVNPSQVDAGGSHGGLGAFSANFHGPAGDVFDSVYVPQLGGGGASIYSTSYGARGGNGGGAINLTVGTLNLYGQILAKGEPWNLPGSLARSGGAGGAVLVHAGTLAGSGSIDASGGAAESAGSGGGGRVALYVTAFSGFDPTAQAVARGGALTASGQAVGYGGAGTVYWKDSGATYGRLLLDSGKDGGGHDQVGPATPLPALGGGAVTAWTAAGGDAWMTAAAAFGQPWLGAWAAVSDATGTPLGEFQVSQIDAQGRALLAGAGSVQGAARFQGEYRFDRVDLQSSAGLGGSDPIKSGDVEVYGAAARLPAAQLTAASMTLNSGAVVTPAAGGALQLAVTGQLTIQSGARIDVSALGYLGATAYNSAGTSAPGVNPSQVDAGGSHGGLGAHTSGHAGPAGDVYDSVYLPQLGGGGSSIYSTSYGARGGNGGGTVSLTAGTLQLDGQILAKGEPWNQPGSLARAGGAGGAVTVHAGTLAGAGSIDVSGGAADGAGSGGGGRVALYVTGSQTFAAASQVKAQGGALTSGGSLVGYAGPGTVLDRQPGQTYGSLRVDGGAAAGMPIAATPLPAIGPGTIGSVTPAAGDPTSVWITAQAGTPLFSLGAAGMWVRINGVDYPVSGQSADRTQLLLQGAAGAAAVGQHFFGLYKFDQVTVTGDAAVQASDALLAGSTQVDPGATLTFPDLLPPAISGIQPAAGTVYTAGQPVAISATVTDDDLASVTIGFGEQSVTLTAPPFAWTVPAPPVAAASDVPIQVSAVDGHGNSATATQLVHVLPATASGPPAVAIACPTAGAMLAPGTTLSLAATASETSGIAKVELFLGSATTPLVKVFSPPYTLAFTAPAGSTDGQLLHLRVRATSFGDTTAEAAVDLTAVTGNVLTAPTAIAAGNTAYDGASLIVAGAGATVTIDGPHTFRDLVVLDGATVNHSPTTAAQENHLVVTLTRNLYVSCGGAVDVTGLGYLGGASATAHAYGYGNTTAEGAAPTGAGGSFGGRGGRWDGSSPVYGSFWNPQDPGAGGGWASGTPSGANGGGVVVVNATGTGIVDGAVRANGGQHPAGGTGGGAGGSVILNAASLAGAGIVQALGGPPTAAPSPAQTGGGAGGRIALYGNSIDAGLLSRTLAAGAAGTSTDPSTWGAAGTVFAKLDANAFGDLIVDNGGIASSQITELLAVGSGTVTAVASNTFTDSLADFHHDLSGIDVLFNGNAGALYPILANAHHGQTLTLQVAAPPLSGTIQPGAAYSGTYTFRNVTVRGGAQVVTADAVSSTNPPQVASGSTWTPGYAGSIQITSPAAGATVTAGTPMTVSASVTDVLGVSRVVFSVGGQSVTASAAPFTWSTLAPGGSTPADFAITATAYGSSGNHFSTSITIHSNPGVDPQAPVVTIACPRTGALVAAGSTIPISFTIADATQVSSYSLIVNGTVVQTVTANQATVSATLNWTVPAGTPAGNSFTVQISAVNPGGHIGYGNVTLVTASSSALTGNVSLGSSYSGQALVLGAGTFTVPAALSLSSLTLMNGAHVVGVPGQPLALTVSGALTVQCGATIDAGALGYVGGTVNSWVSGTAPAGVAVSKFDAGGSHGGAGKVFNYPGPAGAVYDSVYLPQLGGGGGSMICSGGSNHGGSGGGVVTLTVGTLQLDGQILARGESRPAGQAGGAGGSVLVTAATVSGAGSIDASGGAGDAGCYGSGPGGGGRVALYATAFQGFDPTAQVLAQGANQLNNGAVVAGAFGGPGTIFWKDGNATYGRLLVDSGKDGNGNDRLGPLTPLPALGSGAVTAWTAQGSNALLTAASSFGQVWLGAWVAVLNASGTLLGEFQVSQIDAQGRLLLAGAGGVTGAAAYQGEYRFDRIDLKSSAGLTASDPLKSGDVEVYGQSTRLPAQLTTASMTVNAGSVATAAVAGAINLTVTGTLNVKAGARIDVSALGYVGGTVNSWVSGTAPAGVAVSKYDAGGSHGGAGKVYNYPGPAGAVYDSVYLPQLAGGGGSMICSGGSNHGGSGGGVVTLTVGTLQLDGQIVARGESRPAGQAGGAGGSVVVTAATVAGAGSIDVSGGAGDAGCYGSGPGGGGRVALYATAFQGFDPTAQVLAEGANQLNNGAVVAGAFGGPGTIFWKDGNATYGRLLVDSGKDGNGNDRSGPLTPLPALGSGAVTAWTAQGSNALLTAATPFGQVWLGAWVVVTDASGTRLGEFLVSQIDAQGRLLLAGAGAMTGTAASFQGEYRFDRIDLKSSAGLTASDPLESGDVEVFGQATRLPAQLSATSMTINAGSVATAAVAGAMNLTVTGTLDIQAGAKLDVSALGYLGGTVNNNTPGLAPPGVAVSKYDAGGSHGGAGSVDHYAGPPGAVYDSAYWPLFGGGGGSMICSGGTNHGGSGGGALTLTVGTLQLDGQILARGESRPAGQAGGAGGSVLVQAATIAGTGSIDASGGTGDGGCYGSGPGGGGRVALIATTFSGFDPTKQALAQGAGQRNNAQVVAGFAGPGTVFWKNGGATYGQLIVDSGQGTSFSQTLPITPLPGIGVATVGTATADALVPANLWITASGGAAFQLGLIGMWVRVNGTDYPVLAQSADLTSLELAGAAGSVAAGAGIRGVYKFDEVDVRGGAKLQFNDTNVVGVWKVDPNSQVIQNVP